MRPRRLDPHRVSGAKSQLGIHVLKGLMFILLNEMQFTSEIVISKSFIFCILIIMEWPNSPTVTTTSLLIQYRLEHRKITPNTVK